MNKIAIYTLITIVFTLEVIAIVFTLTLYIIMIDCDLVTVKLIDKL